MYKVWSNFLFISVVEGVLDIDIAPEEMDRACAEFFMKLMEVMKEMKDQPGKALALLNTEIFPYCSW